MNWLQRANVPILKGRIVEFSEDDRWHLFANDRESKPYWKEGFFLMCIGRKKGARTAPSTVGSTGRVDLASAVLSFPAPERTCGYFHGTRSRLLTLAPCACEAIQ